MNGSKKDTCRISARYTTDYGRYYVSKCEDFLSNNKQLYGKVQLILTSPPFPLNNKKRYGNYSGDEYRTWFSSLAPLFAKLLTPDGSIVIEMGNAWEQGRPIQSLLTINSLLDFLTTEGCNLRLCQEFICHNPARLPSPAQWVTVNRIRAIDSFTRIWWMATTDYPKADNTRILRPYSKSMRALLNSKKYNSGKRPSEHVISETGFLKEHEGSISPNVLELDYSNSRLPFSMLKIANTNSNDYFTRTCKERGIIPHPARMPLELASFFIEFLTDEDDLILDPFAGSNTTGFCAEKLGRKWIGIEVNEEYCIQSKIRFENL